MFHSHLGEFAALGTAIFWTVTALAFSAASRRVGSLSVNFTRLLLAYIFLGIYGMFTRGNAFASDASIHNWVWLSFSGLIGFVLGDYCLFQSYTIMPARVSMLVMALAPPIAAITGWLFVGETMSLMSIAGMIVTLVGIAIVVLERQDPTDEALQPSKVKFAFPLKGILYALGGAAGQGIGIVLSKYGMQGYNPFAATQIRILAGIIGFAIVIALFNHWKPWLASLQNGRAMGNITIGSFFGPFLGVSFSLVAVQHTSSGIASTIMAIVPVLIIVPSIVLYHEKVTLKEICGAILSLVGVALFFL
jgi:drug/metabolite transporter (DMT)-like permease